MEYINTDKLPAGENVVVAIACYTGANVEDSVIINQSAVDRGLFRSTSFRKSITTIQKNQSTSQDDIFIKPDPSKVTGIRHGSYDKLNEKGFVPEETKIINGDIIIGKVSPIQPIGNSLKTFKDNSESYKSHAPGIVDKVWTKIYNNEGYEMRKMRIRSERIPRIGDKFCSRMGQKGTIGVLLSQSDMPFTKDGISPDIIVNSNAFPSRMTCGQLIECLVGKVAAIRGHEADGTPFRKLDIDSVKDTLEGLGYNRNGFEYMYNGMTGKKLKTMIFIGPTYYQRLKHMVLDKIHCLTLDHEVLTNNGWKVYDKLTIEDKIATLKNNKLVYENPTKILYYPDYDGELYHIKTQQIDLNVTTNHRMYVSFCRKRIWSNYELHKAEDIFGKFLKYKKNAEWEVKDYKFVLPSIIDGNNVVREKKILNTDNWLKFFGFWIAAEGWTTSNIDYRWLNTVSYVVYICQVKPKTINWIIDVIEKLGYYPDNDKDKIRIFDKQLYEYMKQWSKDASEKVLPTWVWNLSARQCKILIESMILGDSTVATKDENCCYYTTSIKLANDFMRLCLHAGWSCNKYLYHNKERTVISNYDVWQLCIVKDKNYPSVNHGQNIQQVEQITKYKGPVFCLQVPSEVFYVRRNGKPVWTGNSRARGPRTKLTHQAPEGRSRDGGLRFGEMERDSMIAYGLSRFLKERLVDTADGYTTHVCITCGLFAQRMLRKDNKPYVTKKDIYYCPGCRDKTDVAKIRIPYAFKLLCQEMMSMNIAPRIKVRKNKFSE